MTDRVCAVNKFMQTSSGVTVMDDYLKKFFYEVWERKQHAHEKDYLPAGCCVGLQKHVFLALQIAPQTLVFWWDPPLKIHYCLVK